MHGVFFPGGMFVVAGTTAASDLLLGGFMVMGIVEEAGERVERGVVQCSEEKTLEADMSDP